MRELDHKEGWMSKNWFFRTPVLEKTLENLLNCKEIQPINPKGNKPWIFIGRIDTETEAPILWPPDGKNWFTGARMLGNVEGKNKGSAEDGMVRWHHWLNGHKSEQTSGDSTGQRSLACMLPFTGSQSQTRLSDWTTAEPNPRLKPAVRCVDICMHCIFLFTLWYCFWISFCSFFFFMGAGYEHKSLYFP